MLDLPADDRRPPAAREEHATPLEVVPEQEWRRRERANVLAALQQADYRVSGRGGAAERLGVNARTLTSRVKALGLNRRHSRIDDPRTP